MSNFKDLRVFVLSAVILLASFAFGTALMLLTLDKHQTESLLGRYAVVAADLERRIDQSLRFGKVLPRFYGMENLLDESLHYLRRQPGSADRIDILLADGEIRYSTDPTRVGTYPDSRLLAFTTRDTAENLAMEGGYYLFRSIRDINGNRLGTVLFFADGKPVAQAFRSMLDESLAMGFVFFVSGMALIAVGMFLGRKHARVVLLVLICLCQAGYITERVQAYGESLQASHWEKVRVFNSMLQREMEHLLRLGLSLENLYKMDVLLARTLQGLPEVEEIRITDPGGKVLHTSAGVFLSGERPIVWSAEDRHAMAIPLISGGDTVGRIHSRLSESYLGRQARTLYMDAGTVALISIFMASELLAFLGRRGARAGKGIPINPEAAVARIRIMAFFFFFGTDIAISFLPLHMASLYQPVAGLPREMVLGLPITVQMIFTALAFLSAGRWSDRRGWQWPFLSGLMLAALGFFVSGWAAEPFMYLAGMAIVGYGYGLTYMAGQNFVVRVNPDATRGVGLSQFYAGCIAGSLCGGAAGALLADRVGYSLVFMSGGVILVLTLAASCFYLRHLFGVHSRTAEEKPVRPLIDFFKDRKMLAVVFCSSLPSAIALVGFMNYFSPIYLNEMGASQSTIGRFFMLYGICMIYLAPWITRLMGNMLPRFPIILAGVLGSSAFWIFYVWEGVSAVGIGILLLGFAACFNAARNAYAINLPVSQEIGEGRAMGTIFFVARLGQVAGPLIFGLLLATGDLHQAIFAVGAVYLFLTLFFAILTAPARARLGEAA